MLCVSQSFFKGRPCLAISCASNVPKIVILSKVVVVSAGESTVLSAYNPFYATRLCQRNDEIRR